MGKTMSYIIAQPSSIEACRMVFAVQPFLAPAVAESRGEMTMSDVFGLVFKDLAKVWLVFVEETKKLVGVAVTEEVEYPRYKNLRVTLLGGHGLEGWKGIMDREFLAYCTQAGLSNIEVVGRKGFTRVLAPLGYESVYTVLLKNVKEAYCG
jgi:hypothetical protein